MKLERKSNKILDLGCDIEMKEECKFLKGLVKILFY